MRAAWIVAKREMLAFFVSPIAYIVITSWLLVCGVTFTLLCFYYANNVQSGGTDTPLSFFFGGTTLFYLPILVYVPVMTMRLLAEERRSGTIETLLTAPISELSVVLGKYFAALVFWVTLWVPTLMYVWIISRYGDVDMGVMGASYLGVFCMGVYFMAVGLFMSAISRNQIVAALLTFMVLGALFVVGIGEFVFQGTDAAEIFGYLSIWKHMEAFSKGIVDTRYLTFDVSIAVAFLFMSVRALEARRGGT